MEDRVQILVTRVIGVILAISGIAFIVGVAS